MSPCSGDRNETMQMSLKKLVGATAIAGALGLPAFVVGAGVANAATPAPSIPGPVHTVQTPGTTHVQLVDDDGGWGWGGWGDHRDWDRGGWGDRGDWGHGGWGGDRGDWGHGGWGGWGWGR
jgi:hypothetical protein